MEVEDACGLALLADISAIDIGILHQLDDRVPAGLVEAVLENEACGVASGAAVADQPLHALVLVGLLGQRGKHDVSRQLPHEIRKWLQHQALLAGCGHLQLCACGLEGQGLRPDPVFSGRQRRKEILTGLIGKHRGRDGAAGRLGRDGHAGKLFAGSGRDGAAQDCLAGRRSSGACDHCGEGAEQSGKCGAHDVAPLFGAHQRGALGADAAGAGIVLRYATIASICAGSK